MFDKILLFLEKIFKDYPALKALLVNVAAFLALKLGFHLNTAALVSAFSAILVVVHSLQALGIARAKADIRGGTAR